MGLIADLSMLCVEIGVVGRREHGRHADDLRDDQARRRTERPSGRHNR